jgi:hypothetical protein
LLVQSAYRLERPRWVRHQDWNLVLTLISKIFRKPWATLPVILFWTRLYTNNARSLRTSCAAPGWPWSDRRWVLWISS